MFDADRRWNIHQAFNEIPSVCRPFDAVLCDRIYRSSDHRRVDWSHPG